MSGFSLPPLGLRRGSMKEVGHQAESSSSREQSVRAGKPRRRRKKKEELEVCG